MRTGDTSNSANETAAYLIASVSSPISVYYTALQYNEISNTLPLFAFCFVNINSRKNVVQGTYIH